VDRSNPAAAAADEPTSGQQRRGRAQRHRHVHHRRLHVPALLTDLPTFFPTLDRHQRALCSLRSRCCQALHASRPRFKAHSRRKSRPAHASHAASAIRSAVRPGPCRRESCPGGRDQTSETGTRRDVTATAHAAMGPGTGMRWTYTVTRRRLRWMTRKQTRRKAGG
jgi:hypothetical protein